MRRALHQAAWQSTLILNTPCLWNSARRIAEIKPSAMRRLPALTDVLCQCSQLPSLPSPTTIRCPRLTQMLPYLLCCVHIDCKKSPYQSCCPAVCLHCCAAPGARPRACGAASRAARAQAGGSGGGCAAGHLDWGAGAVDVHRRIPIGTRFVLHIEVGDSTQYGLEDAA